MESVLANLSLKTRRATLNGREYIVAPLTLIVPGVLNGSKGALYYPPEEVAKDPTVWNGFPLVVHHPTNGGSNVSARSPDVYASQNIGTIFNATAAGGKLTAEGWFDVEATRRIDKRVLDNLERGKPIELSTGLFTDNDPAPEGASYNGKSYAYIAKNYRPDHVAILPDQVGACSVKDGCGVLVNEEAKGVVEKFWQWLTGNTNPEGCNQYKGCEGGEARHGADIAARLKEVEKRISEIARRAPRFGVGALSEHVDEWNALHAERSRLHIKRSEDFEKEKAVKEAADLVKIRQKIAKDTARVASLPVYQKRNGWEIVKDESSAESLVLRHPITKEEAFRHHKLGRLRTVADESPPTDNAAPGQVRSSNTGQYKPYGAGTGKGDFRDVAQLGAINLTEEDQQKGRDALTQAQQGDNPPSWVDDEAAWDRAKGLADKGDYDRESGQYWAVVSHIYGNIVGNSIDAPARDKPKNQEETMNRKETIDFLTTNCDCWKNDAKTLNEFSDEKLTQLLANAQVILAVREAGADALTVNAMPAFIKEKIKAKEEEEEEEEEEDMVEMRKNKVKNSKHGKTKNEAEFDGKSDEGYGCEEGDFDCAKTVMAKLRAEGKVDNSSYQAVTKVLRRPRKRLTTNEWFASAPSEIQSAVRNAMEIERRERMALVGRLTENLEGKQREVLVNRLQSKPLEELKELSALVPVQRRTSYEPADPLVNYLGAAVPTSNQQTQNDRDDILPLPTINWSEEAKRGNRKQA